MNVKDEAFLKRLLATFRVEATEHLQAISSGLVALENASTEETRKHLIESIYRETHSLKGAAHAVNLTGIGAVCQAVESVFGALKSERLALSAAIFEALYKAVDMISDLLAATEEAGSSKPEPSVAALIRRLEQAARDEEGDAGKTPATEDGPTAPTAERAVSHPTTDTAFGEWTTVRIPTARLDALFMQAEEFLTVKRLLDHQLNDLRSILAVMKTWEKAWQQHHPVIGAMLQSLMAASGTNGRGVEPARIRHMADWLEGMHEPIYTGASNLNDLIQTADRTGRSFNLMVDQFLEDARTLLLMPFSSLLQSFPRVVRDISKEQGKEVDLVIEGENTEIDRRILERMKDPLMHLVRNSIDHGCETAEERARKQKPPRAVITLSIEHKDNSRVELRVTDDGRGIDTSSVVEKALAQNLISLKEAEQLDEQERVSLIFHSGVSTSPILTDISGRGLGLAIVREEVEKLGGAVTVTTRTDAGTTFRIVLPGMLATFRGILVRAEGALFFLPVTSVERVLRVERSAVKTVENRETIILEGRTLSVVRLGSLLGIPGRQGAETDNGHLHAVALAGDRRMAFIVDEVVREQEVTVKPLDQPLSRLPLISGVTVIETGQVIPVLNIPELFHAAVRMSEAGFTAPASAQRKETQEKHSILVVEDSITARTLIRNILEGVGYTVDTAVDGIDALTKLRTADFHLVVSDVDMPRMNGFDLTKRIREDKKMEDLPVVLVTALDSREDRERGIDVGANAYIVKTDFNQSNLLDAIRRLL